VQYTYRSLKIIKHTNAHSQNKTLKGLINIYILEGTSHRILNNKMRNNIIVSATFQQIHYHTYVLSHIPIRFSFDNFTSANNTSAQAERVWKSCRLIITVCGVLEAARCIRNRAY